MLKFLLGLKKLATAKNATTQCVGQAGRQAGTANNQLMNAQLLSNHSAAISSVIRKGMEEFPQLLRDLKAWREIFFTGNFSFIPMGNLPL